MTRSTIELIAIGFSTALWLVFTGCSRRSPRHRIKSRRRWRSLYPSNAKSPTTSISPAGQPPLSRSKCVRASTDILDSVHFEAGSLVKKGDVLFVIDQRPFVRELNRAKAQLEQAQAEYQHALTQIESAEAAKIRADADLENARLRHRACREITAERGHEPGRVR